MIRGPIQYLWTPKFALLSIFALLILFSAIGVVYTKHQSRMLYATLQQLQNRRDALHIEWSQLLLEQGALASDVRIEKVAREQLGMYIPSSKQITVVWP